MSQDYFRRVEAWLYSIPGLQVAISNLKQQLEQLEEQLAVMPTASTARPDRVKVAGGEHDSIQDRWLNKQEAIEDKRNWLKLLLKEKQAELDLFTSQLEQLRKDDHLAADVVELRYIKKFGPEKTAIEAFTSERSVYRARKRAVEYFFNALPWLFTRQGELK